LIILALHCTNKNKSNFCRKTKSAKFPGPISQEKLTAALSCYTANG